MYESFYGLAERPFTLRPDPNFLYLSQKHSIALSMLEYGLTGQTGFVVVTGDIGSGKTTLIRHFLKRVDRRTQIGVISNTHVSFGDVLQWVSQAFDLKSDATDKAARYQTLLNYLVKQHGAGYQLVLIVDEAQNLTIDALEELRLLSNLNTDTEQLLQIIVVGQPELLEKLKRPDLQQFAQRISVHYHLLPLTYLESRAYIRHRLSVAGAKRNIFDTMAIGSIYHFTNGVPRLINSLCDMSLVYAFAEGKETIDMDVIWSVVRDREMGGIQALARSTADMTRECLIERIQASFGEESALPVSNGTPDLQQGVAEMGLAPDEDLSLATPPDVDDAGWPAVNNHPPKPDTAEIYDFPVRESGGALVAIPAYPDESVAQAASGIAQKFAALRWMRWLL